MKEKGVSSIVAIAIVVVNAVVIAAVAVTVFYFAARYAGGGGGGGAGGGTYGGGSIYINGNSEFIPANGVTGGSGTQSDPYIIQGWSQDASSANGIDIQNTTAYFVIRNCLVENGVIQGLSKAGIFLENVVNGIIENNTCENNWTGIDLFESSNNTISGNTCEGNVYGIYLFSSSDNNTLTGNNLLNNTHPYVDAGTNNHWS